jgi:transcriptional regulator with XRE-family HTH domain
MITADQCRAARILAGISAADLAALASVGIATVKRFESGQPVQPATVEAIELGLTTAGISFIAAGKSSKGGGDGVRLTSSSPS